MGYNAGGYGSMTFPDAASIAAWKKSSHAGTTVAKRLAAIAKAHDPKDYCMQLITIDGVTVELVYDDGEDGFRDNSPDLIALMRSADAFGAKGTFYFLGTAGAEGDFAYELALDGKKTKSTMTTLKKAAIRKAYGDDYDAFQERLMEMYEAGNDQVASMMKKMREGDAPTAKGGDLHTRVVGGLADKSDAALAAAARKYPMMLPDGKGLAFADKHFASTKTVRALLVGAANEEHRGAALFTLVKLDHTSVGLAIEALGAKATSEPVRASALHALSFAKGEHVDTAVELACSTFEATESIYCLMGATAVLRKLDMGKLEPRILKMFPKLKKSTTKVAGGTVSRGSFLVSVLGKRDWRSLAVPLASYATSRADPIGRMAAEKLLVTWKAPAKRATPAKRRKAR